jgi:hypothetical protein
MIDQPRPQPKTENAGEPASNEWTVLIYFAGDNNLTSEMVWGLQELQKTAAERKISGKKVDVIAHFDPGGLRSRRYDLTAASNGKDLTQDGNLEEVVVYTQRFVDTELLGRAELTRMGRPGQRLSAFVLSQIRQLKKPADRYLVVLSGHGSGAEGDFLIDSDPTTSLSIPELRIILREARRQHWEQFSGKAGKETWSEEKKHRIKILGMDSCLMSNVEVCYEVRYSVDYLVASEGFVENTGWPYHRVLEALLTGTSPSAGVQTEAVEVAKKIANSYARFYRDYEISGVSTDIAVCDLQKFFPADGNSLIERLRTFAKSLIPRLEAAHALRVVQLASKAAIEEAKSALAKLAGQIACELKCDELVELLNNGSEKAMEILETGKVPHDEENGHYSAKMALVELMQSLTRNYQQRERRKSKRRLADVLLELQGCGSWPKVESADVALAVVRALRELDPGVQKALALVEEMDAKGLPEAKKAREMLLRFHHIRQVLELWDYEICRVGFGPKERNLLDNLVAARSEAQSFKGGTYVDLYDFCDRIRTNAVLKTDFLDGLKGAISSTGGSAVVVSHTTGAAFQHAHGLSVYFPVAAEDYTPKYMNLLFAKDTGWGRLVRAYLEATRKTRYREEEHWFGEEPIRRYETAEIDPLHSDDIEARIIGVEENAYVGEPAAKPGRGGGSNSSKGGGSNTSKGGGSNSSKGKIAAISGNPPDGYRRSTWS